MKVLELKGYKSLRALNAFHTLMLGMKMLPAHLGESYEAFYSRFSDLAEGEQASMIREAALFVELTKEEVEALVCFVADDNGVPYEPSNLKNLGPSELIDVICAVCQEIGKIRIDIVNREEKKK